jgi:tetratricopeptide (TPR) repeat protein
VSTLQFAAAKEFKLLNQSEFVTHYADQTLDYLSPELYYLRGEIFMLKGDLQQALPEIEQLVNRFPTYQHAIAKLGLLYAQLQKSELANVIIERLSQFDTQYSYGLVPYQQAAIYAHLGQPQTALNKIEEAIQNGCKFYSFGRFETDPDLMILHDDPRFQKLMKPLEN